MMLVVRRKAALFVFTLCAIIGFGLLVGCSSSEALKPVEFDGGKVSAEGSELTIVVDENPTTGYTWVCEITNSDGANLALASDDYDAPDSGNAGEGGVRTLVLKASEGGKATVVLTHGQQWEGGEIAAEKTIEVTMGNGGAITELTEKRLS